VTSGIILAHLGWYNFGPEWHPHCSSMLGGFGIYPMLSLIHALNTHKMSIERGWRPHCWLSMMPALA